MRRYLMVVVIVLSFLSVLPKISWSHEVEGLLDPLCGPCELLGKKTIEAIPTSDKMSCLVFGEAFGSVCSALAGENPAAVLCVVGGGLADQTCQVYGSPDGVKKDPGGAAKHMCKKIKLCRK